MLAAVLAVAVELGLPMRTVGAMRSRVPCTAGVPLMPEVFMDRAQAFMGTA